MKVIILAGGKGTRLPLSAKDIPKPLVSIHGKAIIDYQIDFFEKQGLSDIRFSLGHMAEKIIDHLKSRYHKKYEWVVEPERLGTGGALKFASQDLKEDFIALNVDDFPQINLGDFVNFHKKHFFENTLAIYRVDDARDFGLVKHKNNLIEAFLEKPQKKIGGHINTGFYILSPKIFDGFAQNIFSIEKDVFPVLAKNKKLAAYDKINLWFTTGTEERLKHAARILKKLYL